ncbi:thioredoxin domain-containing protein [candidate division WWE3 bacterium]|nr:thioredoxin domain-containing protein [candidate division WWE3 bacterium]
MESTTSTNSSVQQPAPTLNTPVAIVLAGLLVAGGIYFGMQSGGVTVQRATNPGTVPAVITAGQKDPEITTPAEKVQVSIDDDAVEGKKDAPVTLIEFSDYECPFCKRSYEDTLVSLRKDYIETGKVKMVFRDFPLSFHDPLATTEAIAANCAREQTNDEGYYKYHDELYKRTTSNGNGLKEEDLTAIAKDLKLDVSKFENCRQSGKYRSEIEKDITDATNAGVTGTPTFFVGKSTENGTIEGEIIVGAVPYASLKPIIDKYLQ